MDGADAWRTYPYSFAPNDPELVFPAAEGDQGAESNTYYVAGRLRGRTTRRDFAFLVIFTFNDVRKRIRADFYTFALFDLTSGDYATYSEFDLPRPLRVRRGYKLSVASGGLDVAFASAVGPCRWTTRRTTDGKPIPFAYALTALGTDARGRPMRVELELDTMKPPMPVGGDEYGGVKTCMGQYGTHSYFQADVRFRGSLHWGEVRDEVDGDAGWIDRQWTPRYLGIHSDRRNSTYRHEWRQIHLDNGVEMSVWLHVDRRRANRAIPFSGVTAAMPDLRVQATTEFAIERLSFVRDPGHVRPQYPLTRAAKYFADRYRLRVPAWDLDVYSEPLVAAPAHALPIEYWSGPTSVRGSMQGRPVQGFGFHERTLAFARDFELIDVLRNTIRHLPADAFPADSPGPVALADRVWEVDAFLSHHGRAQAREYLRAHVRPWLGRLAQQREHVLQILVDLEALL